MPLAWEDGTGQSPIIFSLFICSIVTYCTEALRMKFRFYFVRRDWHLVRIQNHEIFESVSVYESLLEDVPDAVYPGIYGASYISLIEKGKKNNPLSVGGFVTPTILMVGDI
jgi:hypothetical protein